MATPLRVGLISDTHGLLRPQAVDFLQGSDLIVHGGDICDGAILTALAAIAPVIAVRGNNDHGEWAERLRESELFQVGDAFIYAIHDVAAIDIAPRAAGVQVVVSGHSHSRRFGATTAFSTSIPAAPVHAGSSCRSRSAS